MTKSSAQLEREAEHTRAQLAATLDELRGRMTPGQVFDEVMEYARDGSVGEFARNLRRQVGNNPVPAALAGLGLAWLMMSAGRATHRGPSAAGTTDEWSAGTRDVASRSWDDSARAMHGVRDNVADAAGSAADTARRAMDGMRDTLSGAAASVTDTASSAASRLSEKAKAAGAAFGTVTSEAQSRVSSAASAGRGWLSAAAEQPLVLAGIGIAIGAALGAALPVTETENKLMGEKADKLKERAGDMAAEQYKKAEDIAGSVYDHVKKEAEKFGFKSSEPATAGAGRQFGESRGQPFGGNAGQQYGRQPGEQMPAVNESVSMAPSGDESAVPSSDEAAIRQEQPKLRL
jgi:uncharacterized protein DUF3618